MKKVLIFFVLILGVSLNAWAGAPRVLKASDVKTYKDIFAAQKKNQFKTARSLETKLSNPLLMGYVLFDRYFSKKYKTSQSEIMNWMNVYSDLPVAVDIYALGNQKKVRNLKRPKGLFGSNTKACLGPARPEPIDLVLNLNFSYLSTDKKKEFFKQKKEIIRLLGRGETQKAQAILEQEQFVRSLKQVDLDKIRTAIAYSYILEGNDEVALELVEKAVRHSEDDVPLSLWVAGLASWRQQLFQKSADYFSDLADLDDAPISLRTRAAYWAARSYLSLGKYKKVVRYFEESAKNPRHFYGMLAMRALGKDLNYVWDTPLSPADEVIANFSHPALERFYALKQLGKDEWATQELSKLYLEADDEAKGLLMMISEQNGFADVLQSLTGTLQGEEVRYPVPNWVPQGGWLLDKALVYAFVRQESCFNNRAESYVGALGLMQIMPDTAKELAHSLQCSFSKHSLKDPAYNLRLGQAYLIKLMEEYPCVQNNLMFLAVAYNAGPGNLNKWKNRMKYQDDPLLFLEVIPSKETRGFVERILVNYWVYRNLMESSLNTLDETVQGRWPIYERE